MNISSKEKFLKSTLGIIAALSLVLSSTACAPKITAALSAPPPPATKPDDTTPTTPAAQPVAGVLQNRAFKPATAVIKNPAVSGDDQNYLRVYLSEGTYSDPCSEIGSSNRFVAFYIDKANPLGRFDMSVRRGATQARCFMNTPTARLMPNGFRRAMQRWPHSTELKARTSSSILTEPQPTL